MSAPFPASFKFDRVSQTIGTNSFAEQILHTFRFDLLEQLSEACRRWFGNRSSGCRNRALVHVANIRNGGAERAEQWAEREDHDGLQPRLFRHARREKAAVPAVRKERVLRQILRPIPPARAAIRSATDSNARSIIILHAASAEKVQRLRDERLDCFPRQVAIDRLRPAQKIFRIDQPRGDECVGERCLVAAQAVARGPGNEPMLSGPS